MSRRPGQSWTYCTDCGEIIRSHRVRCRPCYREWVRAGSPHAEPVKVEDDGPSLQVLCLPVEPLEALMRQRGYPLGLWHHGTEEAVAAVRDWPPALHRALSRARRERRITILAADKIATYLGVHPVCIWGWDYFVGVVGDVEVPA